MVRQVKKPQKYTSKHLTRLRTSLTRSRKPLKSKQTNKTNKTKLEKSRKIRRRS